MALQCIVCCHVFISIFIGFAIGANLNRGNHYNITRELLSDYGPTSPRPVRNSSQQMEVTLDLQIRQVISLNERDQTLTISGYLAMTWRDEFLTWDIEKYPDVESLPIPVNDIWRPDIHLYENVDKRYESIKDVNAFLSPNGDIYWLAPVIYVTSCRINAELFPFDTQHCTFNFGSWSYKMSLLNIVDKQNESKAMSYFVENGIWQFRNFTIDRIVQDYGNAGLYSEIIFTVALQRRPLFHVFSFLIPCGLLSLLNLFVFVLPTESGEKVSLGVTNLLSLVLFQQLIADSLPPSSQNMPIMSYYFTPMIVVGCISIISGVIVAALYHHDRTKPVPCLLKKIFRLSSTRADGKIKKQPVTVEEEGENSDQVLQGNGHVTMNSRSVNNVEMVYRKDSQHSVIYPDEKATMFNKTDDPYFIMDYGNEWKQLASNIDKVLLVVCSTLTFCAVIVTISFYVILSD